MTLTLNENCNMTKRMTERSLCLVLR